MMHMYVRCRYDVEEIRYSINLKRKHDPVPRYAWNRFSRSNRSTTKRILKHQDREPKSNLINIHFSCLHYTEYIL